MITLIEDNLKAIDSLCKLHQVVKLTLFGSAASEQYSCLSDIDLLVEFKTDLKPAEYARHYFALRTALEQLLGREVDLLTVTQVKNPYLKTSISNHHELLYAA